MYCTSDNGHVQLYTVYLFRTASSSELTSPGIKLCFLNTGDTSGRAFHVSNADILPFPANDDVVSDPLKAWKYNKPLDQSSPRAIAMAVSYNISEVLTNSKASQTSPFRFSTYSTIIYIQYINLDSLKPKGSMLSYSSIVISQYLQ